jgi:hypothetical protein
MDPLIFLLKVSNSFQTKDQTLKSPDRCFSVDENEEVEVVSFSSSFDFSRVNPFSTKTALILANLDALYSFASSFENFLQFSVPKTYFALSVSDFDNGVSEYLSFRNPLSFTYVSSLSKLKLLQSQKLVSSNWSKMSSQILRDCPSGISLLVSMFENSDEQIENLGKLANLILSKGGTMIVNISSSNRRKLSISSIAKNFESVSYVSPVTNFGTCYLVFSNFSFLKRYLPETSRQEDCSLSKMANSVVPIDFQLDISRLNTHLLLPRKKSKNLRVFEEKS